jgi:catechol 2,3-dioxygenase-like lactoylglutathione lyase family enzyme
MPLFNSHGIDHVGIRYRDLERAAAWFRDVLGFEVHYYGKTMAYIDVGDGAELAFFQAEGDEPLRQPHHVALRVPDVKAAEAALAAAGVELKQLGPNLGFIDVEGNAFHFMPMPGKKA